MENEKGIRFVVVPVEILQDKDMTDSEKIVYCYLSIFSKCCFQSNEAIAEATGRSASSVSKSLQKLAQKQYIFVEFVSGNSAKRRIYTITENPKKLQYLVARGMFGGNGKTNSHESVQEAVEQTKPTKMIECEAEEEKQHIEAPSEPRAKVSVCPKRSDYNSQEEFEKAYTKWHTVRV